MLCVQSSAASLPVVWQELTNEALSARLCFSLAIRVSGVIRLARLRCFFWRCSSFIPLHLISPPAWQLRPPILPRVSTRSGRVDCGSDLCQRLRFRAGRRGQGATKVGRWWNGGLWKVNLFYLKGCLLQLTFSELEALKDVEMET